MTANINMNENRIKNLLDPMNEQDATNKRYLESQLIDYLKRNRTEPTTSNLNMSEYRILNLSQPQDEKDATNKSYVKNLVNLTKTELQQQTGDGDRHIKKICR